MGVEGFSGEGGSQFAVLLIVSRGKNVEVLGLKPGAS